MCVWPYGKRESGGTRWSLGAYFSRSGAWVAAGHLDPSGVGEAARFQRLEAGGAGQPFDRRRRRLVVGGVEEYGPLRLAICRAREGLRGERAECLYVVRACGE